MTKAKEGVECDGSLESPSPGEGKKKGKEGPFPSSDAVKGIATGEGAALFNCRESYRVRNGAAGLQVDFVSGFTIIR